MPAVGGIILPSATAASSSSYDGGGGSRQLRLQPTQSADNMAEEALWKWFSLMTGPHEKDFMVSLKRFAEFFGDGSLGGHASASKLTKDLLF